MKMPLTDLQARSAARRATRALKLYVDNRAASTSVVPQDDVDRNVASTSALPRDDDDEVDYGIMEFNAEGLQELDAILDSSRTARMARNPLLAFSLYSLSFFLF